MSLSLVEGTTVADRFRLVRPLGQGGMGTVWVAHHMSLDIPCAIKFLHTDAARSPEMRSRFEREAKAAAQLRSPYVVQILDHGTWHDTPYIAMEYLEGEDLSHRLAREGRLDAHATVTIAGQVARALAKAHAAGLVHRDLKPANIFLVRDEDREFAKVLDFGIAKSNPTSLVASESKTKTGAMLGTPYYMSPEQAQGTKKLDHRSDLWSLAVVIFQCLTGKLPFESEALGDLLMKIIVEPIPVPSEVAPVPPGFDAFWVRAVTRDPAQRFQSAKDLVEALTLALGVSASESVSFGRPELTSAVDLGVISEKNPGAAITPPPSSHEKAASTPAIPLQATSAPVVSAISPPRRFRLSRGGVAALALLVVVVAVLFLLLRSSPRPAEVVAGAASASPTAAPEPPRAKGAPPPSEAAPSAPLEAPPVVASASPLPSTTASAAKGDASAREPKPPAGQGKPGAAPGSKNPPKKAPSTSTDFGI